MGRGNFPIGGASTSMELKGIEDFWRVATRPLQKVNGIHAPAFSRHLNEGTFRSHARQPTDGQRLPIMTFFESSGHIKASVMR
jgi:hypothetical protein